MNSLYHTKKFDFLKWWYLYSDLVCARSTSHFEWHNLQSLDKALGLFKEVKFCESDFYFLNGSKKCMVATYNFGSVWIEFRFMTVLQPRYVIYRRGQKRTTEGVTYCRGGSRISEKGVHTFKCVGVRFAHFITFFLNIPWKWNNLVSLSGVSRGGSLPVSRFK